MYFCKYSFRNISDAVSIWEAMPGVVEKVDAQNLGVRIREMTYNSERAALLRTPHDGERWSPKLAWRVHG